MRAVQFLRGKRLRHRGCRAACEPDLDGDCVLSILDFIELQKLFVAGDDQADINGDGQLSILDFIAYQALFGRGC